MCKDIRFYSMGRIVVEMSSELEKQIRDDVAKRLGMKKRNIKIAVDEAIKRGSLNPRRHPEICLE